MRKTGKKLRLGSETIRTLQGYALRVPRGGVETGPTNSCEANCGTAHCGTTAGYPSCEQSCGDCGPAATHSCLWSRCPFVSGCTEQ